MTDKPQPEAFCWATELAMVRDPVTLTVKEAREVSDEMQRMHAENETLRTGYAAARLEIESLRARSAQPAGEYPALPLAITSAPERIWLDLGFNPWEEDAHFSNLHRPTWSADNATGDGIEYVRADRAMRAAQPAGAQQPGAAGLGDALEDAQRAINSMKVEAETAAQGDEQMMLEACETISNEGLQADMAIRAALAAHGQAPAQDANEYLDLLAQCRSAFPIPERGDPLEVHWAAAMADPGEVPGYLQEIAARHAAKAAPAVVAGPGDDALRLAVNHAHEILRRLMYHRDGEFFINVNRHGAEALHVSTIATIVHAALAAAPATQPAPMESVLIDGIAYQTPAPVAAELLRLHIDALQPAPRHQARINGDSAAPKLRAMATTYPAGHQWDKLDAQACIRGALEIEALRSQEPQPSPAAQGDALDAARLDWLIEQDNCVVFEGVNGFCLCWIDEHDPQQSEYQIGTFPTARAAIDAARAAQEGKSHDN